MTRKRDTARELDALAKPREFVDAAPPIVPTTDVPICPVCKQSAHEYFSQGMDYELLTCGNVWQFVCCTHCETVRLHPRPAVEALNTIYPPSYYSYDLESKVSAFALKGKALLDRFKLKRILAELENPPSSFLDIGCGDGRYLRAIERAGVARDRIGGLELNKDVVNRLRRQGYKAYCSRVEDCHQIPNSAVDLITMFHVIEHVADPGAVVRKITGWLSPGGILAVETPNLSALDARLFKNEYWGGYHIPRHWTLFKESSLHSLFQRNGLEVIAIHYQTGHSFWMYSLHHLFRFNRIYPLRNISRWFDPLKGLPMLVAFTGFDILRRLLGFKTSSVLMLARKPRRQPNAVH